jgi:hypothetical protein
MQHEGELELSPIRELSVYLNVAGRHPSRARDLATEAYYPEQLSDICYDLF